jgi:hypothetical protein
MNVVVVGGGSFGKFGNDFVRKLKASGHSVCVISHRTSSDTTETVNFSNAQEVVEKFCKATNQFDTIDLLLYNSNYKGHPDSLEMFTSKGTLKEKLYLYGFNTHVLVPHMLAIEALKKMHSHSKIVFMTTDVIYNRERDENLYKLGYYGGKAYQHQLMLALAECNDKKTIVSSVSPFFDYNNKEQYQPKFDMVYNHILSHDETWNGKVFDCWE